MTDEAVSIVGAGIVGLTTAIWLELAGYETRIHAEHVPYRTDPTAGVHSVASNYAAASVVPYDVEDVEHMLATSQSVYRILCDSASMGVRRQRHFEIHGDGAGRRLPHYARQMEGFEPLAAVADPTVPVRPGVDPDSVEGWVYPCFFVEMGAHMPLLATLYERLGGDIRDHRVSREAFTELPGLPVNCAGYAARELVDDDADRYAHRGHLVAVETDRHLTDERDRPFSYSYNPGDADGEVYAFPRADALVLGGSRIEARPAVGADPGGIDGETVTVDGVDVPARIVGVNRDICARYGLAIDDYEWTALEGWRPVREGGPRIETDDIDGRRVVHNYGHAGSGVTLSWGSARRAARLVTAELGERDPEEVSPGRRFAIARHLQRYVREHD